MKNINRWLRLNAPLIWNMRLQYVLPIALLLHILFYLAGYLKQYKMTDLGHYYYDDASGIYIMAVTCSVLLGIGWMAFYLRNNALKSRYPVSYGRLCLEYLLGLVTWFVVITPSYTYQRGDFHSKARLVAKIDVPKLTRVIARGEHLLAFDLESFATWMDCDAAVKNEMGGLKVNDALVQNGMLNTDTATYSYYHYCGLNSGRSYLLTDSIRQEADATVKSWLRNNQKDSLRKAVQEYVDLVAQFGGKYKLDPQLYIDTNFHAPDYLVGVNNLIAENDYSGTETVYTEETVTPVNSQNLRRAFIEQNVLHHAYSEIVDHQRDRSEDFLSIFCLVAAFFLSLGLISFRFMNLRTWLFSLIGMGIWFLVLALVANAARGGDNPVEWVCLFWWVLMVIGSIVLMAQKRYKRLSGMMHLWWLYTALMVPLMIEDLWEDSLRSDYRLYDVAEQNPWYNWVHENSMLFFLLCIAVVAVLILAVWIPMAKRWQSLPEE